MATMTTTRDQKAAVTINVTIDGNQGDAPPAAARRHDQVTWVIDGDLGPDDEVTIGPFEAASPMTRPDADRRRTGKGRVDDNVRGDAEPGTYHYEITVNRASGDTAIIDPEIQIKP